jgi:hypothetical protein
MKKKIVGYIILDSSLNPIVEDAKLPIYWNLGVAKRRVKILGFGKIKKVVITNLVK